MMKLKHVARIKQCLTKYHTISALQKSSSLLDGSYKSVHKGRSMNFDELREYIPGDDIKDIDWKATARSDKVLVRQYVAERKHNLLLIYDTNKRMLADALDGMSKKDLALLSAGALGYMVAENGDFVGAMFCGKKGPKYHPLKMGLVNLEMILEEYQKCVTEENQSVLEDTLQYFLHNMRRRMILVLVTDTSGFLSIRTQTLKRILSYNDLLVLQIGETDVSGNAVFDMEEGSYLPPFFTKNKKLLRISKEKQESMRQQAEEKCKTLGIPSCHIDNLDELDDKLLELLHKNQLEKR